VTATCEEPATTFAVGTWEVGDWGACSVQCSISTQGTLGIQSRSVLCQGSSSDETVCRIDEKPIEKRVCNRDCNPSAWSVSDWGECAIDGASCVQTREVQCLDRFGEVGSNCIGDEPSRSQSCECPNLAVSADFDLLIEHNTKRSKTTKYRNVPRDVLIVRRGRNFQIWLQSTSVISSVSDIGIDAILDQTDETLHWDSYLSWNSEDERSGWVEIDLPVTHAIGKFDVFIYLRDIQVADFNVIVLFNPYTSRDAVYLSSTKKRKEYVENEVGLIWQGTGDDNTGHRWQFDHFEYANLEVSLHALRRLGAAHLSNMTIVSRQITYAVGRDLCYGKWSGKYTTGQPPGGYVCTSSTKCTDPSSWNGTSELFDVYRVVNRPVQYCQCFVFAGVVTTIGRSLGIPTRPVTNFQSAHDTNANRGIEVFYDHNLTSGVYKPIKRVHEDSVWSFHVWNEMYFDREDIENGDGWQVVDSTPQEASAGGNPYTDFPVMQMGPASLKHVKANIDGSYDNEFVISEVNANFHLWERPAGSSDTYTFLDSFPTDPFDDHFNTIGLQISTKKPRDGISSKCLDPSTKDCSRDLDDVTSKYKEGEPSNPGKATDPSKRLTKGQSWTRRHLSQENEDNFVDFTFIVPEGKLLASQSDEIINLYGDYSSLDALLMVESSIDDDSILHYNFEAYTSSYDGSKTVLKTFEGSQGINAGQRVSIEFNIAYEDYSAYLRSCHLSGFFSCCWW